MAKSLQFNNNMGRFDLEKLKLLYFKMAQSSLKGQENNNEENDSINVNYCPKCKEDLKNVEIPMEDGDIVCDFCNNKSICKNFELISHLRKDLHNLEFICENFIPDFRLLK